MTFIVNIWLFVTSFSAVWFKSEFKVLILNKVFVNQTMQKTERWLTIHHIPISFRVSVWIYYLPIRTQRSRYAFFSWTLDTSGSEGVSCEFICTLSIYWMLPVIWASQSVFEFENISKLHFLYTHLNYVAFRFWFNYIFVRW